MTWRHTRGVAFLTLALDGGELSASRPGRFTPQGKSPWYPLDRRLGGPRAILDVMVKRKIPSPHQKSNPRTPIIQPIAQHHTNWAITAPIACSNGVYAFMEQSPWIDNCHSASQEISHLLWNPKHIKHKTNNQSIKLIAWSRVLLKKLTATQSTNFLPLWNLNVHYHVHKSPLTGTYPGARWIQSTPSHAISPKIHSSLIFPFMPAFSDKSLPFRSSDQNFVLMSHLSHVCYMPHPSHPQKSNTGPYYCFYKTIILSK
jgi:hypothetical protein